MDLGSEVKSRLCWQIFAVTVWLEILYFQSQLADDQLLWPTATHKSIRVFLFFLPTAILWPKLITAITLHFDMSRGLLLLFKHWNLPSSAGKTASYCVENWPISTKRIMTTGTSAKWGWVFPVHIPSFISLFIFAHPSLQVKHLLYACSGFKYSTYLI